MSKYDIGHGDVFTTPDGPIRVEDISTDGSLFVTDPTAYLSTEARSGRWGISRDVFEDGLDAGEIEPASLEAVTNNSETVEVSRDDLAFILNDYRDSVWVNTKERRDALTRLENALRGSE